MNYIVKEVELKTIKSLIESNHYSHSVNGLHWSYCFGLYDGDTLVGGIIYGTPAMRNAWRRYATAENEILELRRLACLDSLPRETTDSQGQKHSSSIESFFIARTLRWLRKNTQIKKIISYADTHHNHSGIIYRASNFQYLGTTGAGKLIIYDGRTYHDKTIRTKYNGKLKPYAQRIKDALDRGEAKIITTTGKHIYLYELQKESALQK